MFKTSRHYYLTISDIFFIPKLIYNLRAFLSGFHLDQVLKNVKLPKRKFQRRINLNYRPMLRLTRDLKAMPRSTKGNQYLLIIITEEATNY